MPRNYAGQTLKGRPFKPEDDLKGANFTGAILRGVNFKGLDLRGSNFENADIRGANFTDANLGDTNFTGTKSGLRKQDMICLLAVLSILAALAGLISAYVGYTISKNFHAIDNAQKIAATASLLVVLFFFILSTQTDIGITLWIALVVLAIVNAPISLLTNTSVTAAGALVGSILGAFVIVAATLLIVYNHRKFYFAIATVFIGIASIVSMSTGNLARNLLKTRCQNSYFVSCSSDLDALRNSGIYAGGLTILLMFLSTYIAWHTLRGNKKYLFMQKYALIFASVKGTSFRGADLSNANFKKAILKNTNLSRAIIKKTCWLGANQLDFARTDASVRDLLVTGQGYKKIYIGANLYGAYLNGANLESANLKGANLSHALLQKAHLKNANLSETLATETDFTGAYFTGTYLEAWNIDSTTILKDIDCQFIFLLQAPNTLGNYERLPQDPNKVFQPGDFEKLYSKTMNTVKFLLRKGVNREAFTAAFQKLIEENPDITPNSIQSIEKKGSDVLVTVEVPKTTDKGEFEQQFDAAYQTQLAIQTNAALLAAEQRHNQDLKEIALNLPQLLSNLTIVTGDRYTMTDNKNQGITAGDGSFINTGNQTLSNSLINLSGTVTNALNRLSETDRTQSDLKTLLTQLKTTIETTPELPEANKSDALEQVSVLANLGSDPQQPNKASLGRKAITLLKGTFAMLPSTATLAKAVSELIPAITKLLGL